LNSGVTRNDVLNNARFINQNLFETTCVVFDFSRNLPRL